ncbi:MAG: hypothetical protein WBL69_05555, partial [Limnochordia bacterium]
LYFDPNGTRLAYQVMGGDTPEIWIGYLGEITRLRLSLEINARIVRWEESGIVLRDSGGDYYRLAAPKYEPIKLSEPIPMVIERKQRLAPQAGQDVLEGFSLTAPGSPGL